jgi:predicted alpha/beta superfamily hydrolase
VLSGLNFEPEDYAKPLRLLSGGQKTRALLGRLLLESPSLSISNRAPLKCSRGFRQWPARVYLATGTRETGRPDRDVLVVEEVRRLEHILRRAGVREGRLLVGITEGATHNEAEWAKRFPEALQFLFGPTSNATA